MPPFHVIVDQPRGWLDYISAIGAFGTVLAAVAALVAVIVTRGVAKRQLDLQERGLRKDLFDRRYAVFLDTGEFLRPLLSSPSIFSAESDEYRRFGETAQKAEMLFGKCSEVCKYLAEINKTAASLSYSYQKMSKDPGDNNAIEENALAFKRLADLWETRSEVFRRDMSLE